jgi:hypothetical protein
VALAAALSMIPLLATPAAANTVPLNMGSGVISIAGNVFDMTPGSGSGPCTEKPDTVAATFNAGGTWSIAGGWSSQFQLGTPPSGPWYQADFAILLNAGNTYTPAAGPPFTYSVATTGPNHVIFQMRIYQIPSCDKSDLACIVTFRMSFTGTLTSSTALPTYTPGGMTLNGTLVGTSSGSMCRPPFTPWPGQPISMTLTF